MGGQAPQNNTPTLNNTNFAVPPSPPPADADPDDTKSIKGKQRGTATALQCSGTNVSNIDKKIKDFSDFYWLLKRKSDGIVEFVNYRFLFSCFGGL